MTTCPSITTTSSRLMELKKKSNFEQEEEEGECVVLRKEMQYLTPDAVYEILIRVSLGTLLRQCRWVCKDWRKLIYDKKFQLIHSQRTPMASGYFTQSYYFGKNECRINFFPCISDPRYSSSSSQIPPSPSLNFLPTSSINNIMIDGASPCGSLLCCVDKSSSTQIPTYYICKPATCEWRKIPNPRTRFSTETMGIVVKQSYPTLQFKILRLSRTKTVVGHHCEVFDSSNWAWKRLEDIKFSLSTKGCGILVNRCLHWLTLNNEIFVFSIDQENWTTIELPHVVNKVEDFHARSVVVHWEGKVGIFYDTLKWMELWILEDYNVKKPIWKMKYHKDLTSLFDKHGYPFPVDMFSAEIAVLMNNHEIIWYNCNNDTYATTNFPGDSQGDDMFLFQAGANLLVD